MRLRSETKSDFFCCSIYRCATTTGGKITPQYTFVILFEFVIGQNIIKNYRFQVSPKAKQKKIGCKTLFCFAKTNFQIQNQNISFSPRGAWLIVAKSGLGALGAPFAERSSADNSPEISDFQKMRRGWDSNPRDPFGSRLSKPFH